MNQLGISCSIVWVQAVFENFVPKTRYDHWPLNQCNLYCNHISILPLFISFVLFRMLLLKTISEWSATLNIVILTLYVLYSMSHKAYRKKKRFMYKTIILSTLNYCESNNFLCMFSLVSWKCAISAHLYAVYKQNTFLRY